jgi:hypothetical protein
VEDEKDNIFNGRKTQRKMVVSTDRDRDRARDRDRDRDRGQRQRQRQGQRTQHHGCWKKEGEVEQEVHKWDLPE